MWRIILSGSENSIPHSLQTVSVTCFSRLKNFIEGVENMAPY